MACTCKFNSLRYFIQSVTRVNINTSVYRTFATSSKSSSRPSIDTPDPGNTQVTARDNQTVSTRRSVTSSHNTSPSLSKQVDDRSDLDFQPGQKTWQAIPRHEKSSRSLKSPSERDFAFSFDEQRGHNGHAPILEVTPESIDALANELEHDTFERSSRAEVERSVTPHHHLPTFPGDGQLRQQNSLKAAEPVSQSQKETWMIQKAALAKKFEGGWNPRKRLSPDALAGIRALHAQFPEQYSTKVLAERFEVSPDAIRRILKSKWTPNPEEDQDRSRRWLSRGAKIWSRYAHMGLKPPTRWRQLGINQRSWEGPGEVGKDGRMKLDGTLNGWRSASKAMTTTKSLYGKALSEKIL